MVNTQYLASKISTKGLKKEHIARGLGITTQALRNKMTNKSDFSCTEAMELARMLELTSKERGAIFFASDVEESGH